MSRGWPKGVPRGPHSEEWKANHSAKMKDRPELHDSGWRAKVSAANMGHPVSQETREKILKANRLRDPEMFARHSAALIARRKNPPPILPGVVCEICGSSYSDAIYPMCRDHDHVTDEQRGMLCGNCNRGLGMFKDNSALLRLAAAYLDRYRALVDAYSNPAASAGV